MTDKQFRRWCYIGIALFLVSFWVGIALIAWEAV